MSISFIGVGNMGKPMTANLVKAGQDVVVLDADADRARAVAEELGCAATESLAELAARDIIITMLPNGHVVQDVLLRAQDGAFANAVGEGSVVVDMSSSEPFVTRETGKALAEGGATLVDAPVSGGVPRAITGELTIMIGGDDRAAIDKVRPILEILGATLFEVGGLGSGHAAKSLNNYAAAATFVAVAEAMAIARDFGLDPETLIDIMNLSTGRSFISEYGMKGQVLSGQYASGFAIGLLAKDVGIAAELGEGVGADAPLLPLVRDRWAAASEALGPERDNTEAIKAWYDWKED